MVVRFDSFETEYHKPESDYCRIRVKSTIKSEVYMYETCPSLGSCHRVATVREKVLEN